MFVGVDGCRGGWLYVGLRGNEWSLGLEATLEALLEALPSARRILIDMPIGLLESGPEERLCDRAARRVLGRPRAASVFPVPVRPALQAEAYPEANAINRRLSERGITRQSWGIVPKLRALDELMRHSPRAQSLLREAHPEVCFWALNEGQAMRHNKKTPAGREEREAVLRRHAPFVPKILVHAATRYRRTLAGPDDLLDASVLALAARCGNQRLRTLPAEPPIDAVGLPMEIVYPQP